VNEVAADGLAALHAAAQHGNLHTVARLIAAGAHRGVRDKYGRRADQVTLAVAAGVTVVVAAFRLLLLQRLRLSFLA
jgi:ankyrin repeat protein